MAVSISSITTNTNDGSSATISVTTSESPAVTNVGDLVIVIHGNDYYTLADMPTPTATGSPVFTSIVNADAGSLTAHIKSWYYIANTGGAQTVSVAETGVHDEEKSLAVYVLSGADTSGSPIDGTPQSNVNASAVTSQDCPAVTTTNTDSFAIMALQSGGGAAATAYAPPGTVTKKYDIRVTTVMSAGGGIKQLSSSGSTGTFTWTATGACPYAAVTFAIKTAAGAAAAVPYNPQRSVQLRDPGETWWLQKDRRNANLVATAANDLDVPLLVPQAQRSNYGNSVYRDRRLVPQQPNRRGDMSLFATVANDLAQPLFQPVDARYWHLYNDVQSRTWRPQQRTYYDPNEFAPVVAMDPPAAQRYVPPRDYGEVQWQQNPRRDPLLLTTALLEDALLGGAETDKRTNVPATHADRREVPQQRQYFDPSLLATALLETPLVWIRPPQYVVDRREVPQQRAYYDPSLLATALLESPLVWLRPQQFMADRRLVPQQRAYISDPSFYPTAGATDPLTVAWGAGGNYWHLYNDVRVERRLVPQQRQLESDPNLLLTALLEDPLIVGSNRQIITSRRVQPRQLRWPDLMLELADPLLVGGGVGGDRWRRYNSPATHADRRQTVRERPRWTVYTTVDLGLGPNVPFTDTTSSGTNVSQTGTGYTQQTLSVAIVSQDGYVIVSQTPGGVL